jgi:hypothetical protein
VDPRDLLVPLERQVRPAAAADGQRRAATERLEALSAVLVAVDQVGLAAALGLQPLGDLGGGTGVGNCRIGAAQVCQYGACPNP